MKESLLSNKKIDFELKEIIKDVDNDDLWNTKRNKSFIFQQIIFHTFLLLILVEYFPPL